jgi:hypothetical protein
VHCLRENAGKSKHTTEDEINPLKPKRREREERKVGWVVRDTTFNSGGENKAKFAATKVPRQCPLVLLVKVSWIGGKTFGS